MDKKQKPQKQRDAEFDAWDAGERARAEGVSPQNNEQSPPKFGQPGYDLNKALRKLRFTKFKGPQYMTHVSYYECVALLDEINRLRRELQFIQEMAAEDIRTGEARGSMWQIEANARAAIKTGESQ